MDEQKNQRIFRMQPILCPWITSQPYHSSLWSKNRTSNQNDPSLANRFNNPWINRQMPLGMPRSQDKPLPSIQQSSSQFFYFLRLMQLFPDTHPATLHTVLVLCKNDFFCAVDKMLYAKRCKLLCQRKNVIQKPHQQQHNKEVNRKDGGMENGGMVRKDKSDCEKQSTQPIKGPLPNFATVEKNKDEPTLDLQKEILNEPPFIINTFAENAEDLSTARKCVTGNRSQI